MKKTAAKRIALIVLLPALLFAGCEKEELSEGAETGGSVSNDLHFAFKTPDWEQKIDCTHLDLPSYRLGEDVLFTTATSASTKNTFFFSFPMDSSDMVKPENLKKYEIEAYTENTSAFQFSLKLPAKSGSSTFLTSQPGLSADSYNEVVSIMYDGYEGNEAIFKVKCKYQLLAEVATDPEIIKPVSGTYHFKIRTTRN